MTASRIVTRALAFAAALPIAGFVFGSGFRLAERFSGRKIAGFIEGDWFALLGLLAAVAVIWLALRIEDGLIRKVRRS